MSETNTLQSALASSWDQVWTTVFEIIPALIGAFLVFVIGLFIAFWVKRLVVRLLEVINVDKFAKTSGIDGYLKKADLKLNLVELIGTFAEWVIILIFFLAVVDILGLSAVSSVLAQVLAFIPRVLAAALILVAGYLIAGVVGGAVRGALTSVDPDIAKPVGKLSRWTILLVTVFAAIDQLNIATRLTETFFQGLTFTVVIAVGLAIGLGSKDLVAKVLDGWYKKIREK